MYTGPYSAIKVSDHVYWVGAIDWTVRDFHGYATERGSTYNAYLILGDKITLIDTVEPEFKNQLLARISSVIEPSRIDYIISNHSEPDHAGALAEVAALVQPEKIFASKMGVRNLQAHFHQPLNLVPVATGDKLSLGNLTLEFIETRMLHWPDSMFTFLVEDGVLFSSDAFGMHLASNARFDDQIDDWEYEAVKYYANILLPYSGLVPELLDEVAAMNLPIKIIAPAHGFIWRKDLQTIQSLYRRWSEQKPTKKVVVAYDTMWGSTAKMADAIMEGLWPGGVEPKGMDLRVTHRSDVVAELLEAGGLIIGTSTLNNGLLPRVGELLTYIKGLRPRNLQTFVFGSYGWSGEAVGQVEKLFDEMGLGVFREGIRSWYVPNQEVLEACFNAGQEFAAQLLETIRREEGNA